MNPHNDIPDYDLSDLKLEEYEIKILMHKPRFHRGIQELREKWNIPSRGFKDNKSDNEWRERTGEDGVQELKYEIRLFGLRLEFSERWDSGIYLFLRTDEPYSLRVQPNNGIKFEYDGLPMEKKNVRSVWIQIDSTTTVEELKEAFDYAQGMLETQKKKQYPSQLDRNLKVWKMYLRGNKNKDIAAWLNDNYPGSFDPNHVAKIIKRTKELLE